MVRVSGLFWSGLGGPPALEKQPLSAWSVFSYCRSSNYGYYTSITRMYRVIKRSHSHIASCVVTREPVTDLAFVKMGQTIRSNL